MLSSSTSGLERVNPATEATAPGVDVLAVSVVDMHALAAAQRTASRRSLTPALLRKGVADSRRAQDLRPGDDGPLTERVYLYFAPVGLITLDRAERLNTITSALAAELVDAVKALEDDSSVGALVVAGDGKAFCAGADITELDSLDGPHDFSNWLSTASE